jgi:hypothetical protein
MVLRHSLDIVVGQYSVAPIAILRHHRGSLETELHRSHKSFEPGSAPSTLSMHGITIKLPAQYGKFGRLQSLCELQNLCRARLQPRRKVRRMNTALALGLLGVELAHWLFSLTGGHSRRTFTLLRQSGTINLKKL